MAAAIFEFSFVVVCVCLKKRSNASHVYFRPVSPRSEVFEQTSVLSGHDKSRSPAIKHRSVDADIVFERVNAFLQRLMDVRDMIQAASDLFTLDAIEIGGIRGHWLSRKIADALTEFQLLYNACKTNYTNILEPNNGAFGELKRTFDQRVASIERKLSQIFVDAFVNANSIESSIKLFEIIGELLCRPIIGQRMIDETKAIIEALAVDVATVQTMLDASDASRGQLVNTKPVCGFVYHNRYFVSCDCVFSFTP